MTIQIVNQSDHPLPAYESAASAGMDLRAQLDSPIVLEPLERGIVKTGLFIELPVGVEAQVRPRSGLAIKKGVTVLNAPGTIDADYRGEIGVILINLSNERPGCRRRIAHSHSHGNQDVSVRYLYDVKSV